MSKKGFTLVEMLAVVILLGVLAMIAVPAYNEFIKKANQTKTDADASAIKDAITSFISDCIVNRAPASISSYCPSSSGAEYDSDESAEFLNKLRDEQYLSKELPEDDIEITINYDSTNYSYDAVVSILTEDSSDSIYNGSFVKMKFVNDQGKKEKLTDEKITNLQPGDLVDFKGEQFYVIKNDGTTLTLLTKYLVNTGPNMKEGATEGLQDSQIGTVKVDGRTRSYYKSTGIKSGSIAFADANYWNDPTTGKRITSSYPTTFVYDSNSNIYQYVNAYLEKLKTMGLRNATATLLDQPTQRNFCRPADGSNQCPEFIISSQYWLGTASSGDYIYYVSPSGTSGNSNYVSSYSRANEYGIRPIINMKLAQ